MILKKMFWGDREVHVLQRDYMEHVNEIHSPWGREVICHAMSLHPLSIVNIPRKKYVKRYQYKDRYRLFMLQMCVETIVTCTFYIDLNCWQIVDFEKICFGGIEKYMYPKKCFWSISMKFLPWGIHLPCHVTSPTIYSNHLSHKWLYVLKCTFLSKYKHQLAVSTNIEKDFTQESPGNLFKCAKTHIYEWMITYTKNKNWNWKWQKCSRIVNKQYHLHLCVIVF